MEDKTFELMEKMYNEFINFKKDMTEFRKETKEDLQGLKNDVLRIENDHGKKLDALFDSYKQLAEGQEEIKSQLTELSSKVEK